MYVDFDGSVEDICYEENHVQTVVGEIRKNFNKYFKGFTFQQRNLPLDSLFGKMRGRSLLIHNSSSQFINLFSHSKHSIGLYFSTGRPF